MQKYGQEERGCIYGMYGRPGIFSKCGIHAGAAAKIDGTLDKYISDKYNTG